MQKLRHTVLHCQTGYIRQMDCNKLPHLLNDYNNRLLFAMYGIFVRLVQFLLILISLFKIACLKLNCTLKI